MRRAALVFVMKNLVACLILLCLSNVSMAKQVVEEWECARWLFPDWNEIFVVAKVFEGREQGHIDVADITYQTEYRIAGFERRWDFGLAADSSYNYAFAIGPDGTGVYYDFSSVDAGESAEPGMAMTCRQKK